MITRIQQAVLQSLTLTCALLCLLVPAADVHAGLWDELSAEEQKMVRERMVDELGKMLNEGKVNENLQFTAQHIGTWATYAGEIVEGNFDNAINATMSYSTDQFLTSFENELGNRINSLDNSALSFVYQQVISHKAESKQIARLALNGDFSSAGNIAWETAKKDVQQQIQTKTEDTLKFAFNWAFDGARIGSYTPADIFLEIIRIERIIIPELKNYLTNTQLGQIQQIYNEELARSGGNHNAAWIMIRDSHIPITAHSVSTLDEETLRQALEQCAGGYSSLGTCIGDVQSQFQRRLEQEKRQSEALLKSAATEAREKSSGDYKELQKLIQRIIAEQSKDYQDAIKEANAILTKVQTQARGIAADCEAFDAQEKLVEDAQEISRQANLSARSITTFLDTAEQCDVLAEAPDDLETLVEQLVAANSTFEGHMQSVLDLADEICRDTGAIATAFSQNEGKDSLDAAIAKQRRLNTAVTDTETSAADVRATAQGIVDAAASLKTEVSVLGDGVGSSNYLETEQQSVRAVEEAKRSYDAALAKMQEIVERLKARQKNMDDANPLDLSVMDQVDRALAGGIDKADKVRSVKLLDRFKDIPAAKDLLAKIKAAESDAACADRPVSLMASPERYRWPPSAFDEDLLEKFAEAKSDCQSIPRAEDFSAFEQRATSIANEMEAKELPFIPQQQAERCIAEGLLAYKTLEDPAAAFSASIEQLEKTCGDASTMAERAVVSAGSAVRLGEGLTSSLKNQLGVGFDVADTLAACENLDGVRDRVLRSAADAEAAAAKAQAAAARGSSSAQRCDSPSALQSMDSDLASIKQHHFDAIVAYDLAQEGDALFDRIVEAATSDVSRMQKLSADLSQLSLTSAGVKDHMRSAKSDKEKALSGFTACGALKDELVARAAALPGGNDSENVRALVQRINSVSTTATVDLGAVDEQVQNAGVSVSFFESVLAEADAARARLQAECLALPSPYPEVLTVSQVIITIDELKTQLTAERDQCLASLEGGSPDSDANAVAAGDDDRGDYDFGEDDGNMDPERVAMNGGAGEGLIGLPLPGEDAGTGDRTQGQAGAPIDPGYRDNPMADGRHDGAEDDDWNGGRNRRSGNSIADEFGSAPDLDGVESREPERDRRERPEDPADDTAGQPAQQDTVRTPGAASWYAACVGGEVRVGQVNMQSGAAGGRFFASRAEAEQVAATLKCASEDEGAGDEAQSDEPRAGRDEPRRDEAPVAPPLPEPEPEPPVEPEPDPRCTELASQLIAQGESYIRIGNQLQAAQGRRDGGRDAAARHGCELLAAGDQFYATFQRLMDAGCEVRGELGAMRDTVSQGRAAMQGSLDELCGGGADEPPAPAESAPPPPKAEPPKPKPKPKPKPPAPKPPVTQFAGKWFGPRDCNSFGDASYRWVVELTQSGEEINGEIKFHRCPGGGRASYKVSGIATADETVILNGRLWEKAGPLANTASREVEFSITKGFPPSPNLAP